MWSATDRERSLAAAVRTLWAMAAAVGVAAAVSACACGPPVTATTAGLASAYAMAAWAVARRRALRSLAVAAAAVGVGGFFAGLLGLLGVALAWVSPMPDGTWVGLAAGVGGWWGLWVGHLRLARLLSESRESGPAAEPVARRGFEVIPVPGHGTDLSR